MVGVGRLPEGNSVQRMFAATAVNTPDFAANLLGLGRTFQVNKKLVPGVAKSSSLTPFCLPRSRVTVTAASSNVTNSCIRSVKVSQLGCCFFG